MSRKPLQEKLGKKNAFRSEKQRVVINLLRTHDKVQICLARLFRQFDLTLPQYNVLRILRGEGKPLRCSEIAERTIAVVPGLTRVVDRLVLGELVQRTQCQQDRRVWWIELTKAGEQLLQKIDAPLEALEDEICRGMTLSDATEFNRLLDQLREPLEEID